MKSEATTDRYFTAVVHAPDGVRFVASAPTACSLTAQVARYVLDRCDDTLWPSAAARVHAFADNDNLEAAIATYFANVGRRWDPEALELGGLATP